MRVFGYDIDVRVRAQSRPRGVPRFARNTAGPLRILRSCVSCVLCGMLVAGYGDVTASQTSPRLALLLADAHILAAQTERVEAVRDALAMTHAAAVAQTVAACPVHRNTRRAAGRPALGAL